MTSLERRWKLLLYSNGQIRLEIGLRPILQGILLVGFYYVHQAGEVEDFSARIFLFIYLADLIAFKN